MAETVEDIMTRTPIHVTPEESVKNVARFMRECGVGVVLITEGASDVLVGMVTDRDLVVRGLAKGCDPGTQVGELCTPAPLTVRAGDSIVEAERVMRENAVRRLPVVRNGKAVGIVSLGDLVVERDPSSALREISTAPPNNVSVRGG